MGLLTIHKRRQFHFADTHNTVAVTICYRYRITCSTPHTHFIYLAGDLTIGSSPACGIVLNGTGVLPVHCTVYRNETDEFLLVPEPEGRTLVDGNRVTEEVNLRQGAMLTVGKANYMRFNNPAEAELIRSTMGSNDRISMPQLDFTSNDSSPTAEGKYKYDLDTYAVGNVKRTTGWRVGVGSRRERERVFMLEAALFSSPNATAAWFVFFFW